MRACWYHKFDQKPTCPTGWISLRSLMAQPFTLSALFFGGESIALGWGHQRTGCCPSRKDFEPLRWSLRWPMRLISHPSKFGGTRGYHIFRQTYQGLSWNFSRSPTWKSVRNLWDLWFLAFMKLAIMKNKWCAFTTLSHQNPWHSLLFLVHLLSDQARIG